EQLFGELDFSAEDGARSVYSPAAYFVDLLALLEASFEQPSLVKGNIDQPSPLDRRPDLKRILLDADNTFTETPYLDIVNEVLERLLGLDPYAALRTRRHPFGLPFSLPAKQLAACLRHLRISPLELYRLFATEIDHDIAAREYLGISPEDAAVLTAPRASATELKATYGLSGDESLADLADVERFADACGLTGAQVRELIPVRPPVRISSDGRTLQWGGIEPAAWLDQVHRFVRLARLTGLGLTDLGLVVDSCCAGGIDLAGLRSLAIALRLHREHGLSVQDVRQLVVVVEPAEVQGCSGDILAPRNEDYRFRLATWIGVAESDIVAIVRRYREHYRASDPGPLGLGHIDLPAVGLLRRAGRLAGALGIGVDELFDVLTALNSEPLSRRYPAFGVLGESGAQRDVFEILAGGEVAGSLWLAQMLFAVVTWMQAAGFAAQELTGILGGRPEADDGGQELTDSVNQAFEPVALVPTRFEGSRFGDRAAKVVYEVLTGYDTGVVARPDGRLVQLDLPVATHAAYDAVTDLGVIADGDFRGLGLGERLRDKMFANLVLLGQLTTDGVLQVASTDGLVLATDFTAHNETVFKLIGTVAEGAASFFLSDLSQLPDLPPQHRAELYDNLIYHGYLEQEGELVDPAFFAEPDNSARFDINVDLRDATELVVALLEERIARFATDPLSIDTAVFAGLRLTDGQLTTLVESLTFNGYVDEEGNYRDKAAMVALPLADFGLALEFYPRRREILDAVQAQIRTSETQSRTFAVEDLTEIADGVVSRRVFQALDGDYLVDGRIADEALFVRPAARPTLAGRFSVTEQDTILRQIQVILDDQRPYRVDPSALTTLGFTAEERDQLLSALVEAGHLTESLAVPEEQLPYFRNVHSGHDFVLTGIEDHSKDIFFILHSVAVGLSTAVTEIVDVLVVQERRQKTALFGALADALGVPAATAAAICEAVTGGPTQVFDVLIAPLLGARAWPADPHLRLAYRRIRRFAQLAGKLGLDATEVTAVFRDQDLAGKFPENLALPPGVGHFDALLETADGKIHVFAGATYWTYTAGTYALTSATPAPLTELSPRFQGLVEVDAAFTLPSGIEWIVGHTGDGTSLAFTRQPGGSRWAPREQTWGRVSNTFDDPARIDGAFADSDGRTYLFCGDQYVRYSTADYTHVDEGYPRPVAQWREREGFGDVPGGPLDAFQAPDGQIHVLTGATGWGRVRNEFERLERLDAAHANGSAIELYAGDQVVRYSDSIENPGVRADEGHPHRITGVPGRFESGVEAAFTDPKGVLHLFKDGTTAAVNGDDVSVVPTSQRWGVLAPALPSGTVDAAFAGLDGRTYLFSGGTYLRYSAGDYPVVDAGYPRSIAADWGGLQSVDAAFVLDGSTYLFGVGGMLFELAPELHGDVLARRLSPALRNRFAEHGFTLTAISGQGGSDWTVQSGQGTNFQIRRRAQRMTVHADGSRFHVRYSGNDYRTPDAGFPKPLSDNWWNVPDGLAGPVDAVLTGRDNYTYLFSGNSFIRFDGRHRWWSEPMSLREHWDSVPFDKIDAAFVDHDGKTYLFSGSRFIRYSTDDYTEVDDQYPAAIAGNWDKVRNNIGRTGRVDAALVTHVTEQPEGYEVPRTYTYLFSGDQYVRYVGSDYERAQPGYPRLIEDLSSEPGLGSLDVTLDGVDAAFADRRTTYLFRGGQCHAVSAETYRRYEDPDFVDVSCAFIEDGSVIVNTGPDGWVKRSAIEGRTTTSRPFRPRTLRTVPPEFRTGLTSVLIGADDNTYLFKGSSCFNTQLNRAYPAAQEWGRPRNAIYQDNRVDAAFVGRDGRTYLFSADQFVVYPAAGTTIDGDPRPIAEHWAGLTSVALAYVDGDRTFLFEHPDDVGQIRHVVYSGTDYSVPDDGYPAVADRNFFDAPGDFPFPQAVLVEQDTMILVSGEKCVSRDTSGGRWSVVRPIERLFPGFDGPNALRTAFTAADGATYFFFDETYVRFADRTFGPHVRIRDRWGLSSNPFIADGATVDAAFVWRGDVTYLFSGNRYVRYTGPGYQSVDAGYPKPIGGNLRLEEPFGNLPEAFEDALDRPTGPVVDAIVGNDRSIHVIIGGVVHTVSPTATATFPLDRIGRVRNTIAETGAVDAALVADRRVYLFAGDQYVRYSTADYSTVDDGYPRPIEQIAAELAIPALPAEFQDGIDAAFHGPDGRTYLFRGRQFISEGAPRPVNDNWGKVRNEFGAGRLDAAFVAPTGELYAFAKDQFVRYDAGAPLEFADPGFPRTIRDDWGDLPAGFESGLDGAFTFEGRTYLADGDRYVRYSGELDQVDRTFPQEFRHRWSGTSDYRLADVHTIVRFIDLLRSGPDNLAALFVDGAEDPYQYLGEAFGWDVEELRWARRNRAVLFPRTRREPDGEIEFLLKLVDLFATAQRLGAGLPELHTEIWSKLYRSVDPDAAASALRAVLERKTGPQDWEKLEPQLHNELNVLKRDALVAALAPRDGDSRELFQQYLIDVDMGPAGTTSRIREAIAATQLFLHRYLLDLEEVDLPAGTDPDELRARLKSWWSWTKNYRIWEANRKVFLYPENYVRPELRAHKTPAFAALEQDLLQSQITADSVLAAYKRYLDEYTEVSRLAIAGGYVYAEDGADANLRKLVVFGRTRTEPRRYYYRGAQFRDGEKLSATWDPWQQVDVAIDAERVAPVHAFGRVFVFWPTAEVVAPEDEAGTTVTTKEVDGGQEVSAPPPKYRVKICYSFYNLNQEWVPAQVLAVDREQDGPITDLSLYVQASRFVPGGDRHDSIVVQCSYEAGGEAVTSAFTLTPELYGLPTEDIIAPAGEAELDWIFTKEEAKLVDPGATVRFNAPADTWDGPWVSVDHKGGSFLCRPSGPAQSPTRAVLTGNPDNLPTTWQQVDAAFELADGTRYFFDNTAAE
ncbi:MAG: hemopexin repeat-containing protein, partial [Kibdelosporangium sp.]